MPKSTIPPNSELSQPSPNVKLSKEEAEIGSAFMLAEFANIQVFAIQSMNIEDKRIDVFLTLSSALLAGLGLLSQTGIDKQSLLLVSLGGALGLLTIGVLIFNQILHVDTLIIDYIRSLNQIRRYFAEKSPHIKPYLSMPTTDTYPKYNWRSSSRRIPMVINGLSAGASIAIISIIIRQSLTPDFSAILVASVTTIVAYFLQDLYSKRIFARAEKKAKERHSVTLFNAQKLTDQ